ncbi:unnamed protein product [Rotaria socialis]|uniref:Uncharacterized protein n=1 Tax=Rotaria socialis TaxID=392032 RepID=A0A820BVF2_9BILA|nr:unnamed protein product [Rotaria socialis]CAF4248590.1 unnamed protein product [Rotaria socialis]CAF4386381.1 unnamed protein product [Rotaria socialis]CAF4589739.1 unnamed protein product [Rotaria socialis]CAF4794335.1 unnamed protein product [Rotaria socialis]
MTTATTTTTTTTTTTSTALSLCNSSCISTLISNTSLVAFYTFDSVFTDSSGFSNNLSGTYQSFVTGYVNNAVSFIYASSQRLTSSQTMNFYQLSWAISYDMELFLQTKNNLLCFGFYGDDTSGSTTILTNTWYHVAWVFDYTNRIRHIYLNGYISATTTNTGYLNVANRVVSVGSCPIGGSSPAQVYYSGYLDHFTIATRVKTACEILQDATLVFFYPFENSVTDQGPNLLVGSLSNSGTSYVSGYTGNALQLSTTGAYFQVSSITGLGISNQAFSVAIRVKPTATSGPLVHVSSAASGLGSWCLTFLGFSSNGQIIANVWTSSNTTVSVTGPILQISPFWTHIVQTWSATNGLCLYINGYSYANVTSATSYAASGAQNYLTLGTVLNGITCAAGSIQNTGQYLGAIDDFYLYSRELSQSEVCQLAGL